MRRGDIAKSLFLLHEMVHFGLWRGAWAGPMATKRGRGHHMEPDDRADEEKASQEGAGLKNGSEKEDGDNCTGPLWGCPLSKSALSPRRQCYFAKIKERRNEAPKSHLLKVRRASWPPWGSPRGPRGPPGGAQGAQNGPPGPPKGGLGDTFGRRVDIAKSLFLLHEMVHFGQWRGPGEARSRPRGAEETLSEVGRATEAEGRRPRGTQRGAKGAPRGRQGTRATSDRPSFGALGPVGGP